ncbi:MAG TPA: cytochrome c oxidase subunit II [bacterium]|nr:cytochrome c oxidase subunit II [bacterium]
MFELFKYLPEGISSFSGDIDSLIHFIYLLTGIFFVLFEGFLIYVIFRFRKKNSPKAKYELGDKWAQIQWVVAFVAVVVCLDFFIDVKSTKVWELLKEQVPATDVNIKVVAKQFDWTFVYPDKEGKFDSDQALSSYRELHVPVGKKVHVILTSQDVIHDFFLPEVRLKQDVMPGREINAWFDTNKVGTYHIVCNELCGFGHTRMLAVLHVDDEKTYENWKVQLYKQLHGGV